jgi:adenosylhomocysteine nucleosidase
MRYYMKKVGIICAVERELQPYLNVIENEVINTNASITFHNGVIANTKVVVLYSGVCKVNAAIATQVMIDKYGVDCIIVSGTAGGLDKRLKIGDTVISTEVAYHDVDEGILTKYHPWMSDIYFHADNDLLLLFKNIIPDSRLPQSVYFGKVVTGETFIDQVGRDIINQIFKPLCVDMETAAIAHVCYANKIPFIAIRSVSDTEESSGEGNFSKYCDLAAKNSFNVVELLLKHISQQKVLGPEVQDEI